MPAPGPDLKEICRRLDAIAGELSRELLPRGRLEGRMWVEASTKSGGLGDSLKVDLRTGKWRWFAEDKFGDMLDLVGLVQDIGKADAIKWARSRLGLSGTTSPAVRHEVARVAEEVERRRKADAEKEAAEVERARGAAKAIFLGAKPQLLGTPAAGYLEGRGIELGRLVALKWGLHCLRFHPSLYHPFAKAHFPALVALCVFPDGRVASLHRTYLVQRGGLWDRLRQEIDGHAGKLLYTKIHGGVIPLWRGSRLSARGTGEVVQGYRYTDERAGPDLRLIEGIENGLTCIQLDVDKRLVATVSLANVLQIKLPAVYTRRTWIRDNDAPGSSADKLLDRALDVLAEGAEECFLARPPAGLKDFNAGVMPANNKPTQPPHDHGTERP